MSLRYRKRTDDYVCRKCATKFTASDARVGVQLHRLTGFTKRRGRSAAPHVLTPAVRAALADFDDAYVELDRAVRELARRHEPLGCLPALLALMTGAIIAGVTARSLRWHLVAVLSVAGTVVMWAMLTMFRVHAWLRDPPLLSDLMDLQRASRNVKDMDLERLILNEAIAQSYLPPAQGGPLLARLRNSRKRALELLGIDDEEPSPRAQAGS